MSRKTIGENPLDLLINPSESKKNLVSRETGESIQKKKQQRLTVQISHEIIEEGKNAVYWCRGMTYAKLVETGLKKAIQELEKNIAIYDETTGKPLKKKGEKFPTRKEDLKSGRPIK